MPRIRTLIFHPALAPYRIDLFNRLRHELDLRVVFFADQVAYHPDLDQDRLVNLLKCDHAYLSDGFHFQGRDFRTGMGRIIWEFEPTVVVSHEFSYATLYIMLYRKLFAKEHFGHVIWTAESVHMLQNRGTVRRALRVLCSRAADSILIYSEAVAKNFARRFGTPPEKMFICANLQEEKAFAKKLDVARALLPELIRTHRLSGNKLVLFVGRLTKVKNLKRAIKAFSLVRRKDSNVLFVVVGDGPQRSTLEAQVSRLRITDRVLFIGHQEGSRLHAWYLLSSLLLLASVWEPYGAVVNESLLAGVPVLCSSHAGANVLIREGENGHLFNPYDVDQLAHLLTKCLANSPTADIACRTMNANLMPVPFERDLISFVQAVHAARQRKQKGK